MDLSIKHGDLMYIYQDIMAYIYRDMHIIYRYMYITNYNKMLDDNAMGVWSLNHFHKVFCTHPLF